MMHAICMFGGVTDPCAGCEAYADSVAAMDAFMPWWREAEIASADREEGFYISESDIPVGEWVGLDD